MHQIRIKEASSGSCILNRSRIRGSQLGCAQGHMARFLMKKLGSILPNQQFAKSHIHELNKCADAILSTSGDIDWRIGRISLVEKKLLPNLDQIRKKKKC